MEKEQEEKEEEEAVLKPTWFQLRFSHSFLAIYH